MYWADMHYSREAAAYESIPLRFHGSVVPRYFGSWTFSMPVGLSGRRRWVRMILIEYVDGECMLDTILRARGATRSKPDPGLVRVDYRLLPPEEERLDILARIVESETAVWWYGGVQHGDVAPRNVIISRSGAFNGVSRVTIIDFNAAYVLHHSDRGRRTIADLGLGKGLPISPIERYWNGSAFACGGEYGAWVPESWGTGGQRSSYIRAAEWLVHRWRASPNFQPPSESFLELEPQYMSEPYRQIIDELKLFLANRRQTPSPSDGQVANGSSPGGVNGN